MAKNRWFRGLVVEQSGGPSTLVLEGLTLQILGELFRRDPQTISAPPHVAHVRELLEARFIENIPRAELAAASGVHPNHLTKVFRKVYGCSIGAYVRRLRISEAERRLAQTDTPLTQIAISLGFYDQSHFTSEFKRQTGMTPSKFRRALRQGFAPIPSDDEQAAT